MFQYKIGRTQITETTIPAYNLQFNSHFIFLMRMNNPKPIHKYNPCTLLMEANPIINPNNNQSHNFLSSSLKMIRLIKYKEAVQKSICGESGRMNNPAMMPV